MRNSITQKRVLSGPLIWLISWLFVAVGLLGLAGSKPWEQTPAPVGLPLTLASAPAVEAESFRGTPIEEIRVGQRVLADNPDVDTENRTQVDPTTWRKLTLQTVMVWDDGTRDEVNVQTLQPPEWVLDHQAEVGAEVLIPMDLVEIGLPEDLRAQVMANEPCPVIRPGVGRVVLTTVDHLNPDVWELDVLDANGRQTTIRPTGFHKIRSFTRQDWVSTKELHEGELIDARGSPLTVLALRRLPGVHRVYNMTVEGEHVYYVSQLAALVHNNGCGARGGGGKQPQSIDLNRLSPPASRPFADPAKLARHGPFDWAKYTPIEVQKIGGRFVIMNGMTRVENARRAGIDRLPAYIFEY